MLTLLFSPKWFYGIDIAFEIISIIVALLISFYSYKLYTISKKKEHKYFHIFFLMIAIAFVFKIMTNFDLYFDVLQTMQIGSIQVQYISKSLSTIYRFGGLFMYRLLTAMFAYGLYMLVNKKRDRRDLLLFTYFIIVLAFLSYYGYFLFHLTMVMLLGFVSYYYYINCKKLHTINSRLVASGFIMLTLANVVFAVVELDLVLYVLAEVLQLAGFCLLLGAFISVIRK
ncbi:MAG: hypothetical protein JW716_05800 [Candidatus Aenigmarchaeota archaeon]|nr:hypothetical protein [Candidatus Aenigmarchaeota archaeon]